MTYSGTVKDGVIVLERGVKLADGTQVQVGVVDSLSAPNHQGQSLFDRLKGVVGQAKGLPSDAAGNVEHYLYGMPKR